MERESERSWTAQKEQGTKEKQRSTRLTTEAEDLRTGTITQCHAEKVRMGNTMMTSNFRHDESMQLIGRRTESTEGQDASEHRSWKASN